MSEKGYNLGSLLPQSNTPRRQHPYPYSAHENSFHLNLHCRQFSVVGARKMALPGTTTTRDVPLLVTSTASSSERRITPSWSITQLKAKLESVTGIPPAAQRLTLRSPGQQEVHRVEAENEDMTQISRWPLVPYSELKVSQVCVHDTLLLREVFNVNVD